MFPINYCIIISPDLSNIIHKKLHSVFARVKIQKMAWFLQIFEFSQKVQVPIPQEWRQNQSSNRVLGN